MNQKAYTFSDVLIEPKYSEVLSRKTVDISTNLCGINLKLPIISANMSNITGPNMVIEMCLCGGMGILHRFNTIENAVTEFEYVHNHMVFWPDYAGAPKTDAPLVGVSIGVQEQDKQRFDKLYEAGANIFDIDVAHGHHILVKNMLNWITARKLPDIVIIAGNIATRHAAIDLAQWGANVVKCGIGSGKTCLTRSNTGVGVPQLYMLETIKETINQYNLPIKIISDGGINMVGDIAKALKFADAVMLGNMLSGTTETPGSVYKNPEGQFYKTYGGSTSGENKGENKFVEGMMKTVPFRGKVKYILKEIREGLQSAFSYCDASNLKEFQENCEFIHISEGAMRESKI